MFATRSFTQVLLYFFFYSGAMTQKYVWMKIYAPHSPMWLHVCVRVCVSILFWHVYLTSMQECGCLLNVGTVWFTLWLPGIMFTVESSCDFDLWIAATCACHFSLFRSCVTACISVTLRIFWSVSICLFDSFAFICRGSYTVGDMLSPPPAKVRWSQKPEESRLSSHERDKVMVRCVKRIP